MKRVLDFLAEEDGLAVTEYGLLLALVAVAVIAVLKTFGTQISTMLKGSSDAVGTAAP